MICSPNFDGISISQENWIFPVCRYIIRDNYMATYFLLSLLLFFVVTYFVTVSDTA